MPVVVRRPLAQDDIVEIWGYIADDSEAQADAFVDRLDAKFQLLAPQPGLGRMREELTHGLRSFPVGRYVVFYESIRTESPSCVSCIARAISMCNLAMISRIDCL